MNRFRRLSGPLPSRCPGDWCESQPRARARDCSSDQGDRLLYRYLALVAVLLLIASPASGYIVFLKDGSQIQTKEEYRIEGDMAILILPSGNLASYRASEIDVEKTKKVNVVDYGTAKLIEGTKETQLVKGAGPEKKPNFGEYIFGRSLALPKLSRREAVATDGQLPTTKAGFVDFMALHRSPFPTAEITTEVLLYFRGQGIDQVRLFQGTKPDRPLVEVVAASEASVFKAIKDAASCLAQVNDHFPELVTAFELIVMTEAQVRAGQFVMTRELADMLVSEQLTVSQFFLRYVEF